MFLLFRKLCKSGPLMEQRDDLSCVLELKHTKNCFLLKSYVVRNSSTIPSVFFVSPKNLRQVSLKPHFNATFSSFSKDGVCSGV